MIRPRANGKLVKMVLANAKGDRYGSKKPLPKSDNTEPVSMKSRKKMLPRKKSG